MEVHFITLFLSILGLARTLIRSTDSFGVRIWLVDNSGSMNNTDGHLVVQSHDPPFKIKDVNCTRWEEVSVEMHHCACAPFWSSSQYTSPLDYIDDTMAC